MSFYNQNTKDNIIYNIRKNIITLNNILSYYISTYNRIIKNKSLDFNNDRIFNKLIIFNNDIIRIINLHNKISTTPNIIRYSSIPYNGGKSSKKTTKPVKKKNITNK